MKALGAEIIVVDTGSTDRTRDIAASFGAKVFDFAWCASSAATRNEAFGHCLLARRQRVFR
jgi:glycosyltransferase involved in cell wall biosynthesis